MLALSVRWEDDDINYQTNMKHRRYWY